jgi:hypothetical protein
MPDLATRTRSTASSTVIAFAVAALTSAGASAGAATVLTGSPNPSVWLQAYQHVRECRQVGAETDPNCSAAAAEALVKLRIAGVIESRAKSLAAARKSPASRPVAPLQPPATFAAPVLPPRPPSDDGEGVDG